MLARLFKNLRYLYQFYLRMEEEITISGLMKNAFGTIIKYSFVLSKESLLKGGARLKKDDHLFGGEYLRLILKYEEFLEDRQTCVLRERWMYVTEEMYDKLRKFINARH